MEIRNDKIIGGAAMRVTIFAFALLALPTTVFAYFDPGTGSLIIQGLIGAVAAIAVFWGRVKSFVRSLFARDKYDRSSAVPEPINDTEPPVESKE